MQDIQQVVGFNLESEDAFWSCTMTEKLSIFEDKFADSSKN